MDFRGWRQKENFTVFPGEKDISQIVISKNNKYLQKILINLLNNFLCCYIMALNSSVKIALRL